MRYPVDLTLFDHTAHTPSLFTLERSMGGEFGELQDYCIPVNSYFPTAEMLEEWTRSFARAVRYYPASNEQVTASLCHCFDLDPQSVVMFNGATELLSWIDQLFLHGTAVVPVPTFGRWTDVPGATGKNVVYFPRQYQQQFQLIPDDLIQFVRRHQAQVLVICNPNNPTAACLSKSEVVQIMDALHDILVVVDESFIDFNDLDDDPSVTSEAVERENVIVVKSLGKALGLHGVRLGYSVSNPTLAHVLRSRVPHWNVNAVAEMVLESLQDHLAAYQQSLQAVVRDRRILEELLRDLAGVTVYPSQANFVFCKMPPAVDGTRLRNDLLTRHGFLVRHCGNKIGSSAAYFRFVARREHESRALVAALRSAL